MKRNLLLFLGLLACAISVKHAFAFREPDHPLLPDFDKRLAAQPPALDPQRQAAAEQLKARLGFVHKQFPITGRHQHKI